MKIIFMGSSAFAVPAFKLLVDKYHVCAVYTKAPRPAGRGMRLTPTPVHNIANEFGIEVLTPENFKSKEEIEKFRNFDADISVVASYGIILPEEILDSTPRGAINIHGSILPKWRGAAPIHRAIMAGDKDIGVSIMKMSKGLDEGDVYDIWQTSLTPDMTTGIAHDILAENGGIRLLKVLDDMKNNKAVLTPQPEEGYSYAHKIEKSDCEINWNKPANEILNFIRALNPFPSAFCYVSGKRVKIHSAESLSYDNKNEFCFKCNDGFIQVTDLQFEGKQRKKLVL